MDFNKVIYTLEHDMAKQLQIVKAVNFPFPLTTNSVTEVCPDIRTELNRNNHDISIYFGTDVFDSK